MEKTDIFHRAFNIDPWLIELTSRVEKKCADVFNKISETSEYNLSKVIHAMQEFRVSDSHFNASTGYGYNDRKEVLEQVFARVFGAEDALVRHHITWDACDCVCLYGILRPAMRYCPLPESHTIQLRRLLVYAAKKARARFMIMVLHIGRLSLPRTAE